MDLAPEYADRLESLSPQLNLQEVLLVVGGRSLDDSDDSEDEDEEDRDPRLLHRNCAFYNTKTSTNMLSFCTYQNVNCLNSECVSQHKLVVKCL